MRGPACLFFDLGAGDGETYRAFLGTSDKWSFQYDTGAFPHDQCHAYLIEANPGFGPALEAFRSSRAYPMPQVAAYMCDLPNEIFHLDVTSPGGWGSSLDASHGAVAQASTPVEVRLDNLVRLLVENSLPQDTVVVKMDIEGAEFDILPCLAKSPAAKLIDTLYVEVHCQEKTNRSQQAWCPSRGQSGTTWAQWHEAIASLKKAGVNIPDGYWSPM